MALSAAGVLPAAPRRRQVWCVGGGKGGVGKSLLTASLGWELARAALQVVLVDADLGGATLHNYLGLPAPRCTLGDFIQRRLSSVEELLADTPMPGLRLVAGACDLLTAADLGHLQKARLIGQLEALQADVVLVDLGAGTSFNVVDFFLLSDVAIVVVVPEAPSVEAAYRFIKSAIYRRLRDVAPSPRARALVDAALDPRSPTGIRTPAELLSRLQAEDAPAAAALRAELDGFPLQFVLNNVHDDADIAVGHQLVAACSRHLGLRSRFAGSVHHDDAVRQAVRRRRPFLADAPASRAARDMRGLALKLAYGDTPPLGG